MSERKPYNEYTGYIASLKSAKIGGGGKDWTVIYDAAKAEIDAGGCRYVVSCEAHNCFVGETSTPKARASMKAPEGFCDGCREALGLSPSTGD